MIRISPDDPVFDAADSDPSVSPAEDFYRFANGGWLDTNPVPPEYGSWGSAHELHVRNEAILHDLLEGAAEAHGSVGSIERTVGDYFLAGMDTVRIEALGLSPIQGWLDRIDAISSIDDVRDLVVDLHRSGIGSLFSVGVLPDFDDPQANLLYLGQGGIGLPDRDYYLRDDDQSAGLLEAYRTHIDTMFTLASLDAGAAGDSVIAIESAIAKESYTNVQMRDVELTTNRHGTAAASDLMPLFGLRAYLAAIGAGDETEFNVDNVGLYPALDAMLESVSLDDWRTYFTWHLLRATASSLTEDIEKESFEFYGRTLGGQQKQKERWQRVLAAGTADIGQLISQLYVAENFAPEAKREMEQLVEFLLVAMRQRL
ncbi:MAG: M13 family metallopeptidase N-terminal domain-containing protein, partial [Actinomycetota bacterium]